MASEELKMRSKTLIQLLSLSALALTAMSGPTASADPAKCQTVEFGPAVSARFPNIRKVCQDVIMKDGQEYALVKGYLVRISSKSARIRPILPDGSRGDAMDIAYDPARKVMVKGKAVSPTDISVGQELSFYVKVSEPVAAMEPADTAPLAAMSMPEPVEETASRAPEMPKTASPLPLIGVTGLALLALGGGLTLVRRRQS
jgi:LPXTG-motif cell wall-anchored protein